MTPPSYEQQLIRARIRKYNAEAEKLERENAWEKVQDSELNHFTFAAYVDQESVTEAISELDVMSRRNPEEPITIVFNTFGGETFHGMALYDFCIELRRRKHHVTTRALGAVFSMGSILLQGGDRREMSRNSFMMIHESAVDLEYLKTSFLKDEVELMKRIDDQGYAVLAERSTLSIDEIKRRSERRDWWLSAQECVDLGLADVVL